MAINKKLIHFEKRENFNTRLANNEINDTSIVFIQDTGELWTHGQFFCTTATNLLEAPSLLTVGDTIAVQIGDKTSNYIVPPVALKGRTMYECITDTADTRGHWTGTVPGVTELYDGLVIHVRFTTAYYGNSEGYNTLNINSLGPKIVWWRYNSVLTTHWGSNAEITLTYRTTAGSYKVGNANGELTNGTTYTDGWVADFAYYSDGNYLSGSYYYRYKVNASGYIGRYMLVMRCPDGTITGLTTTNNSTGTTKTMFSGPLLLPDVHYYASTNTYSANAVFVHDDANMRDNYSLIDVRYTFNCGSTLTANKPFFLVGTIDSNGHFYLDTTQPWSTSYPSTDDGKLYILLGPCYDTYRVNLEIEKPIYIYKNGKLQLYSQYAAETEWANITGKPSTFTPSTHTHPYTQLTGSTTTADLAIVSNGTANGWTLKTLGSNAFNSTAYLPLAGGTMTGPINWGTGATREILLFSTNSTWKSGLRYSWSSNTTVALWGKQLNTQFVWNAGTDAELNGTTTKTYDFQVGRDTSGTYNGKVVGRIAGNIIWHADNDGSGSGLDADLLDGQHGSYYLSEANLTWGGKNFSGSYGPIDAAMIDELGPNRAAFAKAAGIAIEYSRDGGSTWTDYGLTNTQKIGIFSTSTGIVAGKRSTNDVVGVNDQVRVRLLTSAAGIYTVLNKFTIYLSTAGSTGCWCTIKARKLLDYENDVDTYTTFATNVPVSGWSGWNVINTSDITTYGNKKSSLYGEIIFIFGVTGYNGNGTTQYGLNISKIRCFGGYGWTTPSTMAATGHLYSYDALLNATFPSQVTATSFKKVNGTSSQFLKADGSVDSNTYITSASIGNGTLSLQASGTTKTSFTANQSGNATFNIATGTTNGALSVGGTNVTVKGFGSNGVNKDFWIGVNSLYINFDAENKTFRRGTGTNDADTTLGTATYPWKALYATTIYENGTSLASKYLSVDSTKNITVNGSTYALYTSASSLPTIYAPTALAGTGGYILATNSGKTGVEWVAKPTSNISTSAVVSSSATGTAQINAALSNPYYNLIEGSSVARSIRFVAGTGISISAATDGQITITNTAGGGSTTVSSILSSTSTGTSAISGDTLDPYYNLLVNSAVSSSVLFKAGDNISVTAGTDNSITFSNTLTNMSQLTNNLFVNGTQTETTNSWKGKLPAEITSLYDGLTIFYRLPYAGNSSNASLQLYALDGTTTIGANCPVYGGNTRLTTHYPQYSIIRMTYYNGEWRANPYYNTNNQVTQTNSATTDYSPLLMGSLSNATYTAIPTTLVTNSICKSSHLVYSPNYGRMYMTGTTADTNHGYYVKYSTTAFLGLCIGSDGVQMGLRDAKNGKWLCYCDDTTGDSLKVPGTLIPQVINLAEHCLIAYDSTNQCINFTFT